MRFLKEEPPEFRLAGLYVIDYREGIQKMVVTERVRLRRENIWNGLQLYDDTLAGCFEPCSEKDKVRLALILHLLHKMFSVLFGS